MFIRSTVADSGPSVVPRITDRTTGQRKVLIGANGPRPVPRDLLRLGIRVLMLPDAS
jgi:hypothetical protein